MTSNMSKSIANLQTCFRDMNLTSAEFKINYIRENSQLLIRYRIVLDDVKLVDTIIPYKYFKKHAFCVFGGQKVRCDVRTRFGPYEPPSESSCKYTIASCLISVLRSDASQSDVQSLYKSTNRLFRLQEKKKQNQMKLASRNIKRATQ